MSLPFLEYSPWERLRSVDLIVLQLLLPTPKKICQIQSDHRFRGFVYEYTLKSLGFVLVVQVDIALRLLVESSSLAVA